MPTEYPASIGRSFRTSPGRPQLRAISSSKNRFLGFRVLKMISINHVFFCNDFELTISFLFLPFKERQAAAKYVFIDAFTITLTHLAQPGSQCRISFWLLSLSREYSER